MIEKDTVIVIPALNEEKSISAVLDGLPQERLAAMIVVDNGSCDQTPRLAKAHGAQVIHEPRRGYGQACLTGIELARSYGVKYLAFIDGDFSDEPEELSLLLNELDRGNDLVIGSRMLGKAEPGALLPQAYFGNKLATFLCSLFFGGFAYSDLGPFRAITFEAYEKLIMKDTNFGWTIEMQVKAVKKNLKISEISVSYKKRIGVSKITGTLSGTIRAGYKIIWTILKLRFRS